MKCRVVGGCAEGFETDSLVAMRAHYRDAHPGMKSGADSSTRKRDARAERKGGGPVDDVDRAAAQAAAAADDQPTLNLDDERAEQPALEETRPDVGGDADLPRGAKLRARLWGKGDGAATSGKSSPPVSRERRPRTTKRESTAGLFSMMWSGLGFLLIRTEADVPVGRCMQFQADAAGPILEAATRDTFVDTLLQPLAGRVDQMEALASLVTVPLLVGVIERNGPEAAAALEPMLRAALRAQLTAMVPVIKKRQAEEKKWADVVADMSASAMIPEGVDDPVDAILAAIFAGLDGGDEPAPEPAPNGQQYATA